MAVAAGTPSGVSSRQVFAFTVVVILWHIADFLFLRRAGFASAFALFSVFLIYVVFAAWATSLFDDHTYWPWLVFTGMFAMPIVVAWLIKWVGPTTGLGQVISILVIFFPLFIFYLYAKGQLTTLLTIYFLLWLFGYFFTHVDAVQQYAGAQGIEIPYNPALSYEFILKWIKDVVVNVFQIVFVKAPTAIVEEVQRSLAMAKGDYYTGQVDAAAKKRLGVYLENFRATETLFYANSPVTTYVTMKAEILDKPLDIMVSCDADGTIPASKIIPKSSFNIVTSDQYDIDCIWNAGVLNVGSHTLKLRTEFDFITRAYLKSYMMDRERLREYRRQNVDPLEGVPDKQPVAIYTSGPVRIGMQVGAQPIALGLSGEALQPWGVTIENAWEGKVMQITSIFFFVPEGIKITDVSGVDVIETSCSAVTQEEQVGCDDTLVNVYSLTAEELAKETYKNLTIETFRAHLELLDPQSVLGTAPIAVQNFKVSVQYRYMLERTLGTSIREVQTAP